MPNQKEQTTIAALQTEIATLKTIISLLPGNVYWKDIHGFYQGGNMNFARIFHLETPDDLIGKCDTDILPQKLAEKIQQIDKEVFTNQKEIKVEEIGFNEQNVSATYLSHKIPFYDKKGNLLGLLGTSFDITDRKKMEENLKLAKQKAEAANRAKSRFLATITHELRTPLTSILGFANLIAELHVEKNDEAHDYSQRIIFSASYLLSLINNLLDYNRLETKNFVLNNAPLNLRRSIENVLNMLSGAAQAKQLALQLDYPADIAENVVSDARILQQILVNLIGNAIKFTKMGHITVRINRVSESADSIKLRIAVEDTGIGISKKEQPLIFRRFYQLGNVYTPDSSLTGTGLGLAIVKKLVRLLGGQIRLTSKVDQGSTFYFTICFPKASLTDVSAICAQEDSFDFDSCNHPIHLNGDALPAHPEKLQKPLEKAHILLVEDDAIIQLVHRKMLESLGVTIDIAESTPRALALLKNHYDILFVDLGLPGIDGFELIRTIRQQNDLNKQLPIIALTSYSEEEEHHRCLQAGANEVAIKPIAKELLGDIIARYLEMNLPRSR